MFQFLPENNADLVAIKTTKKLNKTDLDVLLPYIEATIKQYGKVKFLWEMDAFEGWEPMSFLRDQWFDIKHANDFRKIAIIGEKNWEKNLADIMKLFTKAQLKYFGIHQKQEAINWIQEKVETTSS